MTIRIKRWCRSRKNLVVITIIMTSCLILLLEYLKTKNKIIIIREHNPNITRRYIEKSLQEALKYDKGTGCKMPILDPFNEEVAKFHTQAQAITCKGKDWVKCYYSECRVVKEILDTTRDIVCTYKDILYENDNKYYFGPPINVYNDNPYVLTGSDYVKIKCWGTHVNATQPSKWVGLAAGFRKNVPTFTPLIESKDSINVLIIGFDSMSKNGFIRRLPKTYKYITEELKVTILHGYNIVGDGTPAALFPILSGVRELELPDARKLSKNNNTLDAKKFIFYKVKQHGYRTAYFEDMPMISTFHYRFNGFSDLPTDHYSRAFYLEDMKTSYQAYCVGDTPRFRIMINVTKQLLSFINTKRFMFTFISSITHEDFSMLSHADEEMVEFFKYFKESGRTKDTLLIFMGDHGSRYAPLRVTFQGRLEERLPLMSILLPEDLRKARPSIQKVLESNSKVLTTPHDIHATILDAMDLTQYTPDFKIPGADLPRGMTLLEPIPSNRSCSEAGIEPHWCACVSWKTVFPEDPIYRRAASALLDFINELTEPVRSQCVPRTLTSISWVMKQQPNIRVLEFIAVKDVDGYLAKFGPAIKPDRQNYQVKLTVGPGTGEFEGTLTHLTQVDKFTVKSTDISRTNMYHHEPDCIHRTHPHLNMYCYCEDQPTQR